MGMFTGIKWKFYALVAGAFILGLIGWRNSAVRKALDAEKAKGLASRIKKMKEMQYAGANIDDSKSGIIDRLRDNGF